mgnify:CR=1 FL=1
MQGYVGAIEDLTKANSDFRRVIFTAPHLQLVLMALKPGEGPPHIRLDRAAEFLIGDRL